MFTQLGGKGSSNRATKVMKQKKRTSIGTTNMGGRDDFGYFTENKARLESQELRKRNLEGRASVILHCFLQQKKNLLSTLLRPNDFIPQRLLLQLILPFFQRAVCSNQRPFLYYMRGGSTSNKPKKDGQQKGSRGALLFAATQRLTDPGESRSSSLSHLLLFRSASTCACPLIFSSPPLPDGLLSTSILLSSRNRAERVGGDEPLRLSGEGLSRLFDFSGGLSLRLLGLMGLRRRGGGVREREALRPRLLGLGLLLRP